MPLDRIDLQVLGLLPQVEGDVAREDQDEKAFDTKSGLHATNFKLIVILEKS